MSDQDVVNTLRNGGHSSSPSGVFGDSWVGAVFIPKIDEVDNLYIRFMRVSDTSQNRTDPSSWLQFTTSTQFLSTHLCLIILCHLFCSYPSSNCLWAVTKSCGARVPISNHRLSRSPGERQWGAIASENPKLRQISYLPPEPNTQESPHPHISEPKTSPGRVSQKGSTMMATTMTATNLFSEDGMTVSSPRIWRLIKSTPLVFTFSLLWSSPYRPIPNCQQLTHASVCTSAESDSLHINHCAKL